MTPYENAISLAAEIPPNKCVCGKAFSTVHAMSCLNGGFVHQRHDEVRD